jgi:hypothetical protein
VATRLEAIHNKTDANQMRPEYEMEHQEKVDASLKVVREDIKTNRDTRSKTKAIQGTADADRDHMPQMMRTKQERIETKIDAIQEKDANLREIMVEMRACRKDRTACQEATKANPEKMEPTDCAIAILEQMTAMMKTNQEKIEVTDLKGNPEEMECESEHQGGP